MVCKQMTNMQISDELTTVLIKLRFMSDVMRYWNCNKIALTEEQLYGYGMVTEQIIDDIDDLNKKLADSK